MQPDLHEVVRKVSAASQRSVSNWIAVAVREKLVRDGYAVPEPAPDRRGG